MRVIIKIKRNWMTTFNFGCANMFYDGRERK